MIKLGDNLKNRAIIIRNFTLPMFLIIFLMALIALCSALPPLPTEFYGVVRDYNYNGSFGSLVEAYDSSGTQCGSFTIINEGYYGSLTCRADDPETVADEGFTDGENIIFRYKGGFTNISGDNIGEYGTFKYVNLTYPIVYCGDNFCDNWYEDNTICPNDCPVFNGTINITTNVTNTSGGESGGGGGTGGGASEARRETHAPLGIMPGYFSNYSGRNFTGQEGLGFFCEENWTCTNWSVCRIDGFQNRSCTDENRCGTYDTRPPEVQKCIYTPTCFDGVKNGLEEGIDCGGLCRPCISCFDGIQNCHDGSCEIGVDCGGPCQPCPSCFDGAQNCHDGSCEEGIDCGGVCEKKCPALQITLPKFVCKKDFNPLSNQSITFFIIILIMMLINLAYSKHKISETRKDKKLSAIKRTKRILSLKRRLYLFTFIIITIAVILYLYYYFFIMCEVSYRFLWLLLILLFISPIIIHFIIKYLEYTESKKLKKLDALLSNHYKQIETLLGIENATLIEFEEELADDLYRLMETTEFKGKTGEELKILREIYKELVILYTKYKGKENPIENEKILCDDIYSLLEDEKYKEVIKQNQQLVVIINKLKIIYQQYEEKQKLYDEIDKIEASRKELKEEKEE